MKHSRVSLRVWVIASSVAVPLFILAMTDPAPLMNLHSGILTAFMLLILVCTPLIIVMTLAAFRMQIQAEQGKGIILDGDYKRFAKLVALLIPACLVLSTFSAARSLHLDPEHGEFFYNGMANIATWGTVGLVVLLTALQRDMYWVNRKKTLKLDERQIEMRQQVFEASYRLVAVVAVVGSWTLWSSVQSLPAVLSSQQFQTNPGAVLLPFYNFVILVFALPMVIAARKQK